LFVKNRAAFNVKQRQDYEREQKARQYAKQGKEAKMSRSEKAERAEAKEAADRKSAETMEVGEGVQFPPTTRGEARSPSIIKAV
jgi:hypothetical protein